MACTPSGVSANSHALRPVAKDRIVNSHQLFVSSSLPRSAPALLSASMRTSTPWSVLRSHYALSRSFLPRTRRNPRWDGSLPSVSASFPHTADPECALPHRAVLRFASANPPECCPQTFVSHAPSTDSV